MAGCDGVGQRAGGQHRLLRRAALRRARRWRAHLALLLWGTFALGCGKAGGDPGKVDLDSTGVDACDSYLATMTTCASKLPAESRKSHVAAIRIARDVLEAKAEADDGR